jgi:hypothetical protein
VARKVIYPGSNGGPEANSQETVHPSRLPQGIRVFEVVVFNQRVRDAVNLGERHPQYDDDWAENRYVEVKADSPAAARRKLGSRYPKHLGFVIVDVIDPSSKFDEG